MDPLLQVELREREALRFNTGIAFDPPTHVVHFALLQLENGLVKVFDNLRFSDLARAELVDRSEV